MTRCLVFDLGAGSGRAMLATYDGTRLALDEVHRFQGYAVERGDGPHWDVPLLLAHVEEGLRRADANGGPVDAIGIDSWGLDYALLDGAGAILGEPHHYRHARSMRGRAACPLAPDALFRISGAQDLPVNTVYQLHDERRLALSVQDRSTSLLMMADVVNHHLTGALRSEMTLARTSGLLDSGTGEWSQALLRRLELPARLFRPIIRPGETYGRLRKALAAPLGWGDVPVIAVAAHDTASATAALSLDDGSGFLICGSWSLIGAEQDRPNLDEAVHRAGFGNEGGVEGRSVLVRSLNGLHLIQKLREAWERRSGSPIAFAEIARLANAARDGRAVQAIDPADPLFFNPTDVVEATGAYQERMGGRRSIEIGELALAIYQGLAAEIGNAASTLERLLGRPLPGLKVCGGGAQDPVLCALVSSTLRRPLRIGPVEASAWGNAVVQLIGLGLLASLHDGRRLIERSATFRDLAVGSAIHIRNQV